MEFCPKLPNFHFHYNARTLLAHGAGTTLAGIGLGGLGLGDTLGQDLGILVLLASVSRQNVF